MPKPLNNSLQQNPHLRRMFALAYVIPKRKSAAQVWFAEARALLAGPAKKGVQ